MDHPIRLVVTDDLKRSRLTVFFRRDRRRGLLELGPGAVVGERALLAEDGVREARVRALTDCVVVAVGRADDRPAVRRGSRVRRTSLARVVASEGGRWIVVRRACSSRVWYRERMFMNQALTWLGSQPPSPASTGIPPSFSASGCSARQKRFCPRARPRQSRRVRSRKLPASRTECSTTTSRTSRRSSSLRSCGASPRSSRASSGRSAGAGRGELPTRASRPWRSRSSISTRKRRRSSRSSSAIQRSFFERFVAGIHSHDIPFGGKQIRDALVTYLGAEQEGVGGSAPSTSAPRPTSCSRCPVGSRLPASSHRSIAASRIAGAVDTLLHGLEPTKKGAVEMTTTTTTTRPMPSARRYDLKLWWASRGKENVFPLPSRSNSRGSPPASRSWISVAGPGTLGDRCRGEGRAERHGLRRRPVADELLARAERKARRAGVGVRFLTAGGERLPFDHALVRRRAEHARLPSTCRARSSTTRSPRSGACFAPRDAGSASTSAGSRILGGRRCTGMRRSTSTRSCRSSRTSASPRSSTDRSSRGFAGSRN